MIPFRKILTLCGFCLLAASLCISCSNDGSSEPVDNPETPTAGNHSAKPFRALVIIGDQWNDPLSYHIDTRRVEGEDFIDVVSMLKVWGVPFEILRLDEQRLQINRFLDGQAKPNYGCVIWMADPEVISKVRCKASGSVSVLGVIGEDPQLVVRDVSEETKVVWIGGGRDWFRKYPAMRGIFRKSLVYTIGYGVFNDNFENGFIFIMDDIGCSEHAWSLRWHYPTPSRETLLKYLIEPLEERGLMMVQNITPGYANPETKMIEDHWTVEPFTDIFGNWQDYGSTKAGLDEGLRRGVFEIQPQCHPTICFSSTKPALMQLKNHSVLCHCQQRSAPAQN